MMKTRSSSCKVKMTGMIMMTRWMMIKMRKSWRKKMAAMMIWTLVSRSKKTQEEKVILKSRLRRNFQ
jgi:hypothetical protein